MDESVDLGSRSLHWERRGSVAWITIDRPERRNALTGNMYFGIRRAVDRLNSSRSLHALVITGTGDVFAPGGELGGVHDDGDATTVGLPRNRGEVPPTRITPRSFPSTSESPSRATCCSPVVASTRRKRCSSDSWRG
jgi:hypothetical protein